MKVFYNNEDFTISDSLYKILPFSLINGIFPVSLQFWRVREEILQPLVLFHNLIGTERWIRISSCFPLTVTRRKIGASPFFNNLLLRMKNKTFIDSCFIPLLIYVVKLISREQTNPTQKHENQ